MMIVEARGVLKQFLSIKNHAKSLLNLIGAFDERKEETDSVRTEYEDARNSFAAIVHKEKVNASLREVRSTTYRYPENKALLREIYIGCDKAIEILGSIIVPVPKEELDRLESLRKELKTLSAEIEDINYEKNVSQAIDEYEKGHILASALISSRVIRRILEGIPGESDKEKVALLKERGILDKERKDIHESVVKSSRLSRNFLSHRIEVFPSPPEALSLLADTVRLLPIVLKFPLEE